MNSIPLTASTLTLGDRKLRELETLCVVGLMLTVGRTSLEVGLEHTIFAASVGQLHNPIEPTIVHPILDDCFDTIIFIGIYSPDLIIMCEFVNSCM